MNISPNLIVKHGSKYPNYCCLALMVYIFIYSKRYYGLSIWFPEYIKKLEQEEYFRHRNRTQDTSFVNLNFTGILDNDLFYNTSFVNVTFANMELRHVTFELCQLTSCQFINITSKKTYFMDSELDGCLFNDTDFHAYKFRDTELRDTELLNERSSSCELDFDISYSTRQVFLENFLGQLVVVPSSLVSALVMDKFGRVPMLGKFS